MRGLDIDTTRAGRDSLAADTLGADTLRTDSLRVVADTAVPLLPQVPRDSVSRLLLSLPGYDAVEYSGTGAIYGADSAQIVLKGPGAQVSQAEQRLGADSMIVYSQTTNIVCGYGQPVLEGGAQTGTEPVQSEQVCYDTKGRVGIARGAKTKFTENASWYLQGTVYTKGSDNMYGRSAQFTTCSLEVPHYHFAARKLKVVRGNLLVARDVTLNFADVPVMWLPFMVQSLKKGRRSGLLMPVFSLNDIARTNAGYNRRISNVGFYWAISDYIGAQMTSEWFANNWTAVEADLDYRWLDQFLDGGLSVRRYWRQTSKDLTLNGRTSWRPDERTSVQVSANYASSSDFVRQNTFDPRELTRSIDSNVGLSRRYDWGNLTVSGQRRQLLSQDEVDLTLPQFSVNLASITLFPAPADQAGFFNNATFSGSFGGTLSSKDVNEEVLSASVRDTRNFQGNLGTSLRIGNVSWSQNVNTRQNVLFAKPAIADTANPDSIALLAQPKFQENRITWSTGLGYQQRLIGTSTLSPSVQIGGDMLKQDTLDMGYVSSPIRLSIGASLQTDLYGFYPGIGPFSRFRHRLSPGISYSYSPAPSTSELQQKLFGLTNVSEQNTMTLSLRQTFEAKYKESREDSAAAGGGAAAAAAGAAAGGAATDTTGLVADTTAADTVGAADVGGPRRLPQARKVMLLSINTSAITYDFVRARGGGDGLTTTQLTNTISSDLLHGLSLSMTHDLFKFPEATTPTEVDSGTVVVTPTGSGRSFAPHLRSLSTSFSISSDSWLFRKLGLAGGGKEEERPGQGQPLAQDTLGAMDSEDPTGTSANDLGVMGSAGIRSPRRRPEGPVGSWNAQISYTLFRPAEGQLGDANQMLQGNVNFQPTPGWNVHWRTGYSITDHQFSDHILSLSRDLHEWQASFDFVKAQNGNFQFRFRVQLTSLPDLHLDYDQRNQPTLLRSETPQ